MSLVLNPLTGKFDVVEVTSIGGKIASATSGSVLFVDASGNLAEDNANLFYDAVNGRLGINTTAPTELLDVSNGTSNITVDGRNIEFKNTGNSIFIGTGAGTNDDLTNNSNNALGGYSLYANTTGNYNNALGYYSLYANTTGAYNNALGNSSLRYNTTGSNNVAIGNSTGKGQSGLSDISNNVLIGYQAGLALLTGGDSNILIGYGAGDNTTTGSKNIVIGYNIDTPSATSTQTLNIGNLIYATGLDGTGATLSTGNVGIGTTAPGALLSLGSSLANNKLALWDNGSTKYGFGVQINEFRFNVGASGADYRFYDAESGNALVTFKGTGNVGIGTAAPNQKLTIEGTMSLKEQAAANADTAAYGQLWVKTATPNELWFTDDAGTDVQLGAAETKNVEVVLTDNSTAPTVVNGLGDIYFIVPAELDGMNLVSVGAHVTTVSSSGLPSFQIHNLSNALDMLSTNMTIDANEKDSATATTAAVINAANDHVNTGDEIRFDCDAIGTGAKGVTIRMGFRVP